ncbi:SEC-C domain-containing protein [Streptomyces poonensis]|uniref:Preprotein translocase SecA n=1 Tax=Streptomyces poonensis TaxID=68255 RepID=A0A918UMN4_9ACTN|nr:SEC-C domain-containing protein [Streptomyces poonensis]GGZ22766.1 preprotein translocase SecA [Streptomyces poonensis]GLJ91859.1 preprotein translocase SecA [Streptomyces poonensis]
MRPDTSAENVDHKAEAARLERTAGLYPEDAEHLLLQAAAHLELSGARADASALYDRLLSSPDSLDHPHLVRALKASNLWEYGHEAEARAIIDGIRVSAPRDPAPWVIAAEALEAHDELEAAQETFTEGATLLLTDVAEPPYSTHPLLFGRHRVRRMLGAPHDEWDALADTLHSASVSLDELHDPKRVWSLGSDNPAELEAEISRLRAELGAYRTALSRPFPVAVLHWPADELAELLADYPSLSSEYPSHEEHLATIEHSLRELAASGTPNLGIVSGTVPSYEAFAASEASSPSDVTLLPQYATTLAARGRAVEWPPQRGTECWCGSGRAYEGCHGVPTA